METPEAFSALELVLMAALASVVGGIVVLARWFYAFMKITNKERAEEIRSSVKVQTELITTIKNNNKLIDDLPGRIQDKIQGMIK